MTTHKTPNSESKRYPKKGFLRKLGQFLESLKAEKLADEAMFRELDERVPYKLNDGCMSAPTHLTITVPKGDWKLDPPVLIKRTRAEQRKIIAKHLDKSFRKRP